MKIPETNQMYFTLQALEDIAKRFLSDISKRAYFAFVWLAVGIFIGIFL